MARMGMVGLGLLLAAACGGSVEGTVGGHTLQVADAVFVLVHPKDQTEPVLEVLISDAPSICRRLGTNTLPGGANNLQLAIIRAGTDGGLLSPAPGPHEVLEAVTFVEGAFGAAFFSNFDGRCRRTLPSQTAVGTGGRITLDSFDPAKAARGTFELTFGGGDTLKGRFDALRCVTPLPSTPVICE